METQLIHINDFCQVHKIDQTFNIELESYDLIILEVHNNDRFITLEDLPKVERMVRLHQDLSINWVGIEAIHCLMERMQQMPEEIRSLKRRLGRYERP
ncbi:chaperone modulator CbpM [Maribacter halichondriae]|uniref:chaperone modulator CbpM n=1 Tax=Maribacter halichondriae TaxID=2980554 RepID=UPI00235A2168|nr:chaperone modulator CbpM [Maribacter sp. Hal144]